MLDQIDFQILNILQENGRTKRNVIAEKVGLSLPSLSERMKKLEERGLIEGYYAKLNKQGFGYDIVSFVSVVMDSSKNYPNLTENAQRHPNVLECHAVLGEGSHILKIAVKNTQALEKLLATIQSWPGVRRTITHFVLSTTKETTKINVE
ncbi:MAG: Lrp/AsnC family transcriptional regulator [Ignavibacteriales bacterium]|nr:Lrp/AsnC family transcriptional regulator [Ignavibacteriales bacterium]